MAVGTEAPPAPSLPEKTGCDGKLGHFCRQQGVVGGQPSASTPREESSSSVLGAGPTTQAMG